MKKLNSFIDNNLQFLYIIAVSISSLIFAILLRNKIVNSFEVGNIEENMIDIYIIIGIFTLVIISISILYHYRIRKSITHLSDRISHTIDNIIMNNEEIDFEIYEETITSKIENKLKQLFETINNEKEASLKEKENIKLLISDISHQIKTPIANISMYNQTIIERELNETQQKLCLSNMKNQVDKLEWLVKCLIKMSRLENGVISLSKNEVKISELIATSLSGVFLRAEAKGINIDVDFEESTIIYCDKKWTSEAIFNILENAVKYTEANGNIKVKVEELEMFTRINISDNGIGIDSSELNNIFKRFYRCSDVSQEEGVGVGLYLSREIISKQGGYIKVSSEKNEGTTFSIYILN